MLGHLLISSLWAPSITNINVQRLIIASIDYLVSAIICENTVAGTSVRFQINGRTHSTIVRMVSVLKNHRLVVSATQISRICWWCRVDA
jgi:hypothetical protein